MTLIAIAGSLLVSLLTASSAAASATYFVAPTGSDAITCAANTHANPFRTIQAALACTTDGDVVSLAPSGGTDYPGVGAVTHNVTISSEAGANARTVKVDVSPTPGPVTIASGASVTIDGISLLCEVGLNPGLSCGPNVTNRGTLTLRRVAVRGSTNGPGIANLSPDGGSADLTVLDSTISDNPNASGATPFGGGIESAFGPGTTTPQNPSVMVANSTIADNGVSGNVTRGGGLDLNQGSATVINSTISGNHAGAQGGGGIGISTNSVTVELSNTIVASNTSTSGPDCESPAAGSHIIDGPGGHNLIGDGTGCTTLVNGTNGDQVGVPSPGLNPLANNGGPTDTVGLQASSPAIAAADLTTCEDPPISGLDQRGEARTGAACDIGAFDTVAVTLTMAATPSVPIGGSISDTATVAHGQIPSGTITFNAYGPNDPTCANAPAFTDTKPVSGNGSYPSASFTPTASGTYRWTAAYSGDVNNASAVSPCNAPNATSTVAKASTALASTATDTTVGGSVHDTATLSGGHSPTGSVTFTAYGPNDSTCSGSAAFSDTVPVTGNAGYASADFTPANSGTYRWTADYSGDGDNNPASSACNAASTVAKASPTIATVASPKVALGAKVHDTASLTAGHSATGQITFRLYGPGDASCSHPAVFTTTTPVAGDGSYQSANFTPAKVGVYRWTATYSGDSDNDSAAGACGAAGESVTVTKRRPALTTNASRDVPLGGKVHDTAMLARGHAPRGRITFKVYGPDDRRCSKAPRFTATKTVAGNRAYQSADFKPTKPGTYRWKATYSGDAGNKATAGACNAKGESVTVTQRRHH